MLERFNPVLRIVCVLLAGLVLYQVSRIVAHKDPLADLAFTPLSLPAASATPVESNATNVVSANTKSTNASRANAIPSRQVVKKEADVPPEVLARVERITQSEILAMVVRPLPMALLGIAGNDAFLRAPNGQTGLLREGEELGGVKLLRIGTNRVLIEHEQQQKELTVFSGFGSETLLPKGEKVPRENIIPSRREVQP